MLSSAVRFLVLGIVIVALQLVGAGPAGAHDGVNVTIHSDGTGSVWASVTWADRHPVDEPVTALFLATGAAGARVGPAAMATVPGAAGVVAHPELLGSGRWHVAVDVAAPSVGHCEADIVVGAGSTAIEESCVTAIAAATSPATTRPVDEQPGLVTALLIGGVVALGAGGLVWLWRRNEKR